MAEKQLVFLIHGMGDHQPGWADDIKVLFRNLYKSYRVLQQIHPVDDHFELVELNYNHFFDGLRSQWDDGAKEVIGQIKKKSADSRNGSKALTSLSKTDRATFLRTHLLDVALYRFFPATSSAIQTHLGKEISDRLIADPGVKWSVVAHSLGTAVAHDTLHRMFSPLGPAPIPMSAFGANVVAMIANVSRLLELTDQNGDGWDVFKSVVRPSLDPNDGCCLHYLNAWHAWDPFIWPSKFSPNNDWPDPSNARMMADIKITEITDRNVHALEHYLANPSVHIELFRRLTIRTLISKEEEADAVLHFQSQLPVALGKQRLKELKKLTQDPNQDDWLEILRKWKKY